MEIIAFIVPKFSNPKDAVTFLEATEPKVKINSEAVALCKVLAGQVYLDKLNDQAATKVNTTYLRLRSIYVVIGSLG